MDVLRIRCTLIVHDGPARQVGPSGLLIGRKQDCDFVSDDRSVSRRHALVRLTTDGAELLPLGRSPIEVNGRTRHRATALAHGDELRVPGLKLRVLIEAQRPDVSIPSHWRLERTRGGTFGIVHSPFMIGGADSDDLIVPRWPKQALRLHVAQRELYLEAGVSKVMHDHAELQVGTTVHLAAGDLIAFRRESFTIRQPPHDATTSIASVHYLPSRVVIEMLPSGGRVVFTVPDGDRAVFLADRRFDLMIALLRPPDGFAAGMFIPDDVVRAVVWPHDPSITRPEINVLISRCRHDMIEAGLAGSRLIERAPGGGATRCALARGAMVAIDM